MYVYNIIAENKNVFLFVEKMVWQVETRFNNVIIFLPEANIGIQKSLADNFVEFLIHKYFKIHNTYTV